MTVLFGAALIDGTGAPARAGSTLVLANGRIFWTDALAQPPPPGIRTIDLRGKYVIPGLWDMHTHFGADDGIVLPLHTANGVTSIGRCGVSSRPARCATGSSAANCSGRA